MTMAINQEWCNQNAGRAYPLKENSTRYPTLNGQALTGSQLPNYVIVDFALATSAAVTTRIYLSMFSYASGLATFIFSDSTGVQVGIISISTSTHVANTTYYFLGLGTYEDSVGKITIGDISSLSNDMVPGVYTFDLAATELEPTTIRPDSKGIKSLRIIDSGETSEPIYGDVTLIAGANVSLTYLPADNGIRIDAITGDGLIEECSCTEESERLTNVVRTINGVAIADAWIDSGDSCIEVTTSGNIIKITNKCTEPCCDCPELEFLTQSLQVLNSAVKNLETYAQQLETRMSSFMQNYILTVAGA